MFAQRSTNRRRAAADLADRLWLDLVAAGCPLDEAEALLALDRDTFEAARPAWHASVQQMLYDACPSGVIRLTIPACI